MLHQLGDISYSLTDPSVEQTMTDALKTSLQDIIDNKTYTSTNNLPWYELKSQLIDKITQLGESSDATKAVSSKLIHHLKANFKESPPFTILRIAELLNDPKTHKYDVDTQPLKLLNALKLNILIVSTISDYPEVMSSVEGIKEYLNDGNSEDMDNIQLAEIPWLHKVKDENNPTKQPKEEKKDEENKSDDMVVSPVKNEQPQDGSSPLKRGEEKEDISPASKRAKSEEDMDISSSSIDTSLEKETEEQVLKEDKMDISEILSDEEPLKGEGEEEEEKD